ncbi:MAG: GFA family protein [Pseudomonadota bacterium]
MVERTGGCACGAVRYRATASPFWTAHCHCRSCRKVTGAAMASFLGYAKAAVTWQGQRRFRASSPGTTRGFCGECGTPLSYMSTRWPGEVHLYAATLDDPTLFEAEAHVHWAERVPWLTIADDLPKHPGRGPSDLASLRGPAKGDAS